MNGKEGQRFGVPLVVRVQEGSCGGAVNVWNKHYPGEEGRTTSEEHVSDTFVLKRRVCRQHEDL